MEKVSEGDISRRGFLGKVISGLGGATVGAGIERNRINKETGDKKPEISNEEYEKLVREAVKNHVYVANQVEGYFNPLRQMMKEGPMKNKTEFDIALAKLTASFNILVDMYKENERSKGFMYPESISGLIIDVRDFFDVLIREFPAYGEDEDIKTIKLKMMPEPQG